MSSITVSVPLTSSRALSQTRPQRPIRIAPLGHKRFATTASRSGVSVANKPDQTGFKSQSLASFSSSVQPRVVPVKRGAAVIAHASAAAAEPEGAKPGFSLDLPLIGYFFFWYLGNYYYNIANKLALKAAGGAAGFPATIATAQLAVGCIYAFFLWAAPDARERPKVTVQDVVKMLPVAVCASGAHMASVFALGAGAVSFAQIVKAAEPAFAAVLGMVFYGVVVSRAKWLTLIPVIGGVVLASVSELDFAWSALIAACVANLFAAFKANENKKLMETEGLKERIGSVGNQFAITTILATLISIPVMLLTEGSKFALFVETVKANPVLYTNVLLSGLYFYGYNELATMTIKKTGAVTQSVANTAKRVIVIVGVALVLGESLGTMKLVGCTIGIGGVFIYSVIDKIFPPKTKED